MYMFSLDKVILLQALIGSFMRPCVGSMMFSSHLIVNVSHFEQNSLFPNYPMSIVLNSWRVKPSLVPGRRTSMFEAGSILGIQPEPDAAG